MQERQRGCRMLLGCQLVGLSKVVALLAAKLSVSMCFPSALSPGPLEQLPVTAVEVLVNSPVSDLKGFVELRTSSSGI